MSAKSTPNIELYTDIIREVNKEFQTNFTVVNENEFVNSVVGTMSVDEFRIFLEESASNLKCDDELGSIVEDIQTSKAPRLNVYYDKKSVFVYKGNKVGQLYATFEIVDLTNTKIFQRYLDSGFFHDDDIWYFFVSKSSLQSMSSSKAIVKFEGYWKYGDGSLIEPALITHTVTYYP